MKIKQAIFMEQEQDKLANIDQVIIDEGDAWGDM